MINFAPKFKKYNHLGMIRFFQTPQKTVIATEVDHSLSEQEIKELNWLYGEAALLDAEQLEG